MPTEGDLVQVKSTIEMNFPRVKQLTQVTVTTLEVTAEALHTEMVQVQVMPFSAGRLEENSFFTDYSHSRQEKVALAASTSYARRLYCHPEYDFQTDENPFAGGEWYEPWLPGGVGQDLARNALRRFCKEVGGM